MPPRSWMPSTSETLPARAPAQRMVTARLAGGAVAGGYGPPGTVTVDDLPNEPGTTRYWSGSTRRRSGSCTASPPGRPRGGAGTGLAATAYVGRVDPSLAPGHDDQDPAAGEVAGPPSRRRR